MLGNGSQLFIPRWQAGRIRIVFSFGELVMARECGKPVEEIRELLESACGWAAFGSKDGQKLGNDGEKRFAFQVPS